MATISEVLKALNTTTMYEEEILNFLRSSEQYGNKVNTSLLKGTTIDGDADDIAAFLREKMHIDEIQHEAVESPEEKAARLKREGKIYELQGVRGRSIVVYDDRCIIKVDLTIGSVVSGNATDGEKTIFYKDCVGVQFKESRYAIGYLQVETSSGYGNNDKSNFFNENTFTFEATETAETTNQLMREVADYIISRVARFKTLYAGQISTADEIMKYKQLLDMSIITAEEFEAKKKQLLDL